MENYIAGKLIGFGGALALMVVYTLWVMMRRGVSAKGAKGREEDKYEKNVEPFNGLRVKEGKDKKRGRK